jgi:membrane associated rhomboid family serine protease
VKREPALNIPPVILAVLALLALIHAVRVFFLSAAQDNDVLWLFAFDPIRYALGLLPPADLPGGWGAQIWTFVTYALFHASWVHLGVNAVWLLPFGSAVARRFGALRFLLFFAATAATGALAHLFAYGGHHAPVIGASAAISGTMAAAMRFAFQSGGLMTFRRLGREPDFHVPALPLSRVLREPTVLIFLFVWFGINALFGLIALPGVGEGEAVAWQAHMGGFLGGLLLFSWFDPDAHLTQYDNGGATQH